MTIAIRAPDHLGDAVMALPAIEALARLGSVTVYTRGRWAGELYSAFPVREGEAEVDPASCRLGVLLKPSLHAAFRWRHLTRRVGIGPSWLLTDALAARAEHRRATYARIAAAAGAVCEGMPAFTARGTAPALPPSFVGLNPWSPTATVRWPGFPALAARLQARGDEVVVFAGPGEEQSVRALIGDFRVVAALSLPDFAAALAGCSALVSNDSGAAHFAAACGASVVMVHGSTDAAFTGVGSAVDGGPLWCRPCYRKACLWRTPCLATVGVDSVLAAIDAQVGSPAGTRPR